MDELYAHSGSSLREKLYDIFQYGRWRIGRVLQFNLVFLLIIAVALVPFDYLPGTRERESVQEILRVVELIVSAIFILEYIVRILVAPARLRFVLSFRGIFDLLCLLPILAYPLAMNALLYLRILRFFRLTEIPPVGRIYSEEEESQAKGIVLLSDERIDFTVLRHPISLLFGAIPSIIAVSFSTGILLANMLSPYRLAVSGGLLLFALIFLWREWLDYCYDLIYITSHRIIFQDKHFLGRSINQVNYQSITNVKPYHPHPLSYLLGYGSLKIETSGEQLGEICIDTVRRHEYAAHMIMQRTAQMHLPM